MRIDEIVSSLDVALSAALRKASSQRVGVDRPGYILHDGSSFGMDVDLGEFVSHGEQEMMERIWAVRWQPHEGFILVCAPTMRQLAVMESLLKQSGEELYAQARGNIAKLTPQMTPVEIAQAMRPLRLLDVAA